MKPEYTYIVRTMHKDNRFIVPTTISAHSSIEAAEERFAKLLVPGEKSGVRALLVQRVGENPQLFYVQETIAYEVAAA